MGVRNFLQDYTALYKSTEIPERFTLWCGIAGISAMLSRKVWMNMGTYTIYPNMYIVLVASPGQSRKSAAVSNMEKLLILTEPSPNLVGNEMTVQGLFDALQEVETDDSSNFLKKTSIGYATIDELVNFLNKKSYEQGLGHFLLKLYDCPPIYESITRGRGKLSLKNACFGFLAGTTLPLLRRAIPADAVGDGLTSRIIFVYNEKKGVPSLFTSLTEKQKEIEESLVRTLSKISQYSGEIQITDEAKNYNDTALGSWARYLNGFSLMSCKGVYEHQRLENEEKRVYILTRSAYAGQQRYGAVTWSGDIHATWEVFRNQISAGLNFCMAGIPYWTTDIGAFIPNNPLGCRDEAYREIYVRWFQFGAFCPMFRSHGSGTPREIWQFGEKNYWAYDTLVKFDELRYRLLPYIYSLAWKVTNENYTIMRGLLFDFKNDPRVFNIDNQYMFGPAFLVNPVTERMYFENTFVGDLIPTENFYTTDKAASGLSVDFYNGQHFDKLVANRLEKIIDFDWNDGSRPQEVNQHYYSIRFSGQIFSREAGEYTFVTTSNDGIRLWVNDQLVIDNWTDHGVTINMGEIILKANTCYNLKMEYYQTLGGAITKLAWITPDKAGLVRNQKIGSTKTWDVYLPKENKWFDFWTGESLPGGNFIKAPAPIEKMPLYVKAGSIIPMGPYLQYATEKPANPIELRIYRGADGEFTIYEDENDNYNYEKGVYATIPIKWDEAKQTLTIGERSGTFPGMLEKRTFQIVWVKTGHGIGVEPTIKPDKIIKYSGRKISVK